MPKEILVKNIAFLRFISKLLPLKSKLNFLIRKYLDGGNSLVIPYIRNYAVVVEPGSIATSTINNLVFEGGSYLPEYHLFRQIRSKLRPGYVCVDVGANIGTIIWQLAENSGHIYAFEPMPKLRDIIQSSAVYNQFTRLSLYNKAVGSEQGFVQMVDNENSSVVKGDASGTGLTIEVVALDDVLMDVPNIDFLKIDVEGFELDVLKGARNLLAKYKPILLVELHPFFLKNYGIDFNEVILFLEENNYTIYYYSFLEEIRMGRINRFLTRYFPHKGKRFQSKEAFAKDIEILPAKLSYHLYCEYRNA